MPKVDRFHRFGFTPPPNTPNEKDPLEEANAAVATRSFRSSRGVSLQAALKIIYVDPTASPLFEIRTRPRQKAYPGMPGYPELRDKAILALEQGRITEPGKTLQRLVVLHPKIDLSDITVDSFDAPACYREHHEDGTLLHLAATHTTHVTALYLLSLGSGVEMQTKGGATPLHIAASNPCGQEIIKALIENRADVDAICTATGETPLMAAIWNGNVNNARLFLEAGANVHAGSFRGSHGHVGFSGGGPLHYLFAADLEEEEREELLKLLLNYGANLTRKDFAGRTPYVVALAIGEPGLAEILLRAEQSIAWDYHFTDESIAALFTLNDATGEYSEEAQNNAFLLPFIIQHLAISPPAEGIDAFMATWFSGLCLADQVNDGDEAQEAEVGRDAADVAVVGATDSGRVESGEEASQALVEGN